MSFKFKKERDFHEKDHDSLTSAICNVHQCKLYHNRGEIGVQKNINIINIMSRSDMRYRWQYVVRVLRACYYALFSSNFNQIREHQFLNACIRLVLKLWCENYAFLSFK